MAVWHKCDVCGNEIRNYQKPRNMVRVPSLVINRYKDMDLCEECVKKLRGFLGLPVAERVPEVNITP